MFNVKQQLAKSAKQQLAKLAQASYHTLCGLANASSH